MSGQPSKRGRAGAPEYRQLLNRGKSLIYLDCHHHSDAPSNWPKHEKTKKTPRASRFTGGLPVPERENLSTPTWLSSKLQTVCDGRLERYRAGVVSRATL